MVLLHIQVKEKRRKITQSKDIWFIHNHVSLLHVQKLYQTNELDYRF